MNFNQKLYHQAWAKAKESSIIKQPINIINNIEPIHLFVFDCLTSSNTKLWELINNEIELPIGAIALEQTAGKGQWGHKWVSTKGGLYLSVALNLDLEIANYPHLVMATAWGIATVLRHYDLPVTIKWFNDLILNQRKLGGIKIETRSSKNKLAKVVVGVGINWCNTVPEPGINLESYYYGTSTKGINSLEELTAITAYGILLGYKYYLSVGIEKLLNRYLAILSSIGQQVYLNGCSGEVIGVTTAGKLRVKLHGKSTYLFEDKRSPEASTEIILSPGQISLGYESGR